MSVGLAERSGVDQRTAERSHAKMRLAIAAVTKDASLSELHGLLIEAHNPWPHAKGIVRREPLKIGAHHDAQTFLIAALVDVELGKPWAGEGGGERQT
jgi:hypothetical protein